MSQLKYLLGILFLVVTVSSMADPPIKIANDKVLNIYGKPNNLSEALRKINSHSDQVEQVMEWKFFSGRYLNKDELTKLCPSCIEIDPVPKPIPVSPCDKSITTKKSSAYSYRIKGTPNELASLIEAAGSDKEIQIQDKYILQIGHVNASAIRVLLEKPGDSESLISVDPKANPIPVGVGWPCK